MKNFEKLQIYEIILKIKKLSKIMGFENFEKKVKMWNGNFQNKTKFWKNIENKLKLKKNVANLNKNSKMRKEELLKN